MHAHGNFQINLEGNIVHVYPVGDFNEIGINELQGEIIRLAPKNTSWALIEHPKNAAGLTPEAALQLVQGYQQFVKLGCGAIGLDVSQCWQEIIKLYLPKELTIPIFFSAGTNTLTSKVTAHL